MEIHAFGARWVDHSFEKQWKIVSEQKMGGKYWKWKMGRRWVKIDGWKFKYGWNLIGGSLQMGGE